MNKLVRHSLATILGTAGIWLLAAAARISPETAQITFEDEPAQEVPQVSEVPDRLHWAARSQAGGDHLSAGPESGDRSN